jgi:hypothetical protein
MSIRPHSAMDGRTRVRMYERTGSTRTRSLDVERCTLHLGTGAVNPQSSISDLQCVGCPLPSAHCRLPAAPVQSPICNLYAAHCRLLSGPMQSAICNVYAAYCRLLSGPCNLQSAIFNLQSRGLPASESPHASRLTEKEVIPQSSRRPYECTHVRMYAISSAPSFEPRTSHLEPFVHTAFDWYLGPQPGRSDSKLSKPDPKDYAPCPTAAANRFHKCATSPIAAGWPSMSEKR